MKKIEVLWENLKNKGLVSNNEVRQLSLEERIQEKINKLSKIERPEARELIHTPIIPIEKSRVSQVIKKDESKDDWQIYEEKKKSKIEKEIITSFKEELDKRFGKGYNSQKLMILFKEYKLILDVELLGFIFLSELPYYKLNEIKNDIKENVKKRAKKILEKLVLFPIALEDNRVLLN